MKTSNDDGLAPQWQNNILKRGEDQLGDNIRFGEPRASEVAGHQFEKPYSDTPKTPRSRGEPEDLFSDLRDLCGNQP